MPAWTVLALFAAVAVAYVPAFSAGFVWDDDLHLLNNAVLLENGLYRVWVLREEWIYYPVTFTSYWLEHQLFGLAPAGYHAVNVAIHALCALLFWRVLERLRFAPQVALLAAALFALHPQNVESVAWITQRKNVLSMLFYLLSIQAYLRFDAFGDRARTATEGARWLWYGWALFAFALGMLSKGSVAPLPFVLLLALAWRRGFADGASGQEPWRRPITPRDLGALAVFLVPALGFPVHDILREQMWLSGDVVRDDSFWARLAGAGWNTWFYLWKTLLPWNLSFVYPRWTIDATRLVTWLPTAAALLGLLAALVVWRRWGPGAATARALAFVAVYYALMVGPILGFFDFYYLRYSYVADHYQYYAQLGLVLPVAWGLAEWLRPRRVFLGTAAVLLALLGALTYRQCLAYESAETLWRDTLAKNPEASLALNGLAGIHVARGEAAEALPLLVRATRADPTNREAWLNAGVLQENRGDTAAAIDSYRQALRHWPGRAGLSAEEVAALPLLEAHLRLGSLRTGLGQVEAAAYHYQRAAQLAPDDARAQVGAADASLMRGALEEALRGYRTALALDPGSVGALEMLTRIYASVPVDGVRDAGQAVALGERAARGTQRADAAVLDALAAAYAEAGRFEEAVATAAEAAALAQQSGDAGLLAEIEERLSGYARGRPHRMHSLRVRSLHEARP